MVLSSGRRSERQLFQLKMRVFIVTDEAAEVLTVH